MSTDGTCEPQSTPLPNRATRRSILRQLRQEARRRGVKPPPEPFAWIERIMARQHLERLLEERAEVVGRLSPPVLPAAGR